MKGLLAFFLLFSSYSYAQDLSVRIGVPVIPPKDLSHLLTKNSTTALTCTNTRTAYAICRLDARIYYNDILIAHTIPGKLSPFLLQSGSQTSAFGLVFPESSFEFTNDKVKKFSFDCKLPEGKYKICVSIQEQGTTISEKKEGCADITIHPPYVPVWLTPPDASIFFQQDSIVFSWTKDSLSNSATYRLRMYEIMQKQTALQAAQNNNSFIDTVVNNATASFVESGLLMKIKKNLSQSITKKIVVTIIDNNEEAIPSSVRTIILKNIIKKEKNKSLVKNVQLRIH